MGAQTVAVSLVAAGAAASLWAGLGTTQPPVPPAGATAPGRCARFADQRSTAFNTTAQAITLPWRMDFPTTAPATTHPWESVSFQTNWQAYMAAVLSEVQSSGLQISGNSISMNANAPWWISPWMDYGTSGREARLGLTKERGPDTGDLSPTSTSGSQVWAIGFYNREGAAGLRKIFADPCNPSLMAMGETFPAKTVSFKLLFTDASPTQVGYLAGAPTVTALIDPAGSSGGSAQPANRVPRTLRLIQVDIAVRDARAPLGWVFGTFIWRNNGANTLTGNLTPVGLMWGNDPNAAASPRDAFATLPSTRLNGALAGTVWRGTAPWPQRPWPGFQGRLNGPADNFRSSCLSCHALAQWPRSVALGIVPKPAARYTLAALATAARRNELRTLWMRDVVGGTLTEPSEATPTSTWGGATPLDYSMQVQAGFSRMCEACARGAMTGPTPNVCRIRGAQPRVAAATCPPPPTGLTARRQPASPPPRQ